MELTLPPTQSGAPPIGLTGQSLEHAFAAFSDAAASLERSYVRLQSEVGRLRQELEDTNQELARSRALAEMSSLLAHEVRNPLGSLELFAGLLANVKLGEEARQWTEQLQAGVRTLAATVNNVLHFHGQASDELRPTDLGELLRQLQRFLQPLAQQARVRIVGVHRLDGVQVAADRHRLEQVFLNLALNAFRFMPQGGVLTISGEILRGAAFPAQAQVRIRDTGEGIPAENLGRMFQAGFTTRPGSPGLGLAVCKTIVEQHSGTIAVTSRRGQGSTFMLRFPVCEVMSTQEERP